MTGIPRRFKVGIGVGVAASVMLLVGVARALSPAPPPVPLSAADTTYACVNTAGHVRGTSVKINVVPTTCPSASDVVRSWSPQTAPAVISTSFDPASYTDIDPAGTRVVVTSLDLPAGSWAVDVDLNASIAVAVGSCELVTADSPVPLDARSLGSSLVPGFAPRDEVYAQLPVHLAAPVTLPSPTTLEAQCVTFGSSEFTSPAFQVRGARMMASAVGAVTVRPSP